MKNKSKVPLVRLFGIIALVAVIVFSMTACGGDDGENNDSNPQTATYTGTSGGQTYTLKITENTARYTAQSGDAYELTVGTKKSTGTVSNVAGGVLTLKPSNAETTFTATVSGTSLTALNDTITWTDNTTAAAPGALTGENQNGGGTTGTSGDFTYTETADAVTITKYNGAGGSVTIPTQINGKSVTVIGKSAFWNGKFDNDPRVTSVTIPDTVTIIGENAFMYCSSIASINIPNSVTSIGQSAFYATAISSVTIPDSVTSIGAVAFAYCTSLTSVTFAAGSNIADADFGSNAFPAGSGAGNNLKTAYSAGKAGTYTRPANGSTWTKQP